MPPDYPSSRSASLSVFDARAGERSASATFLLGQVMFLVAVALGFAAAGTYVGRNLTFGTAEICEFGALGMIIVQMFLAPVREGSIGMCGCLLWRCCWGSASDP